MRLLALAILKEMTAELTPASVQILARQYGLEISHDRALGILNHLLIGNVLSWKRGVFVIASEAVPMYAATLGYLENALAEAKEKVLGTPKAGPLRR